ncbi:hypothetical protein PILCRDRAFT_89359 [Piloderma croceum F 1598]|uniref:Carbohydrate-binding module family 48 protein n=1 Tax=Piloderma croceum (strain F 1598) TaxID=765440 RepID=A0A0C3F924_PILCF|nr:hypothetical protein PILCRDRAFT_89359 [Piloderma croceum F 1598]
MGQSSSNPSNPRLKDRRVQSPFRSQSPNDSAASPVPHRSLRTKKKSLELPDLASLGLSAPSSSSQSPQGPYGRRGGGAAYISSPIPIPIPATTSPLPNPYPSPGREQLPDVALVEPSTHIPIYPERDPRFIRGAPIQYNSTRSFTNHSHPPAQQRMKAPAPAFVPDTVHSTIPIALFKAEQELARAEFGDIEEEDIGDQAHDLSVQKVKAAEEAKEPIPTKILWEGGGRRVVLARAGDNDWKGRHMMEPECATPPSYIY